MTTPIHEALDRQRAACKRVRDAASIRDAVLRGDRIVDEIMVIEMAAREIHDRLPLMLGAALGIKRGMAARGGKRKSGARFVKDVTTGGR